MVRTQLSPHCIRVSNEKKAGDRFSFLLISDVHYDSQQCWRKTLIKDLDKAKDIGAGVIHGGDFFDAMQGRNDRRSSKSELKDEYKSSRYFDTLVEEAVHDMLPYKENLLLFTDGNHETAIRRHNETDLTRRFVREMNYNGAQMFRGGYQGFVKFAFMQSGRSYETFTMYYHHGRYGGVVTKGVLSVARFSSVIPDADIIVSGHTHDRWIHEHMQTGLSKQGVMRRRPQYHLKTGTYKEAFLTDGGWDVETIVMPKNLGGWWMHFDVERSSRSPVKVSFEMTTV